LRKLALLLHQVAGQAQCAHILRIGRKRRQTGAGQAFFIARRKTTGNLVSFLIKILISF
jgi:hypothetical protein